MMKDMQLHDGYSSATKRAYLADWRVFDQWCSCHELTSLPATPETIALFLEAQAEVLKPASLTRRKAAICSIHKDHGHADPTKHRDVAVVLKRTFRQKGRRQKQARALNRPIIDQILSKPPASLTEFRDRALVAVAYDTGCRRSELVAICVDDIERLDDGAATVLIRRAKTDQEGNGHIRYLAADTLRLVDDWLDRSLIEEGAIFRATNGSKISPQAVDGQAVSRRYKAMAKAAGISREEAMMFSGHSTRVGMAQDMATCGIDIGAIMQAGGWKTPLTVGRYIERLQANKGASSRLAVLQNRKQ